MANGITRWNPIREMATMQNMMDRLFEDWRPFLDESRVGLPANALALDVHEDDQNYVITTELPGVKPDQIQVRQEGDYLVIEGETRDEQESDEKNGRRALIKERRFGRYSRRLRLPQDVNFDKAEASYQDGVLTLTLPKSEARQPRTIPVHTATPSTISKN
jgi:HSP20 family protein